MTTKTSVIRKSGPITAMLICAAVQILANPVPNYTDASDSATITVKSSKEFDRLRTQARTSGDFFALAQWCQTRVSKYQQDKAKNEAELREYYSKQHTTLPKFRSLDETLKINIANDEKAMARWSELANQFTEQAHKGDLSKARP